MKRFFVFSVIFAVAAAALALSRLTPYFSDFYQTWIFPLWLNSYGRLTSLSKGSVGEILIYVAAGLVLLFALLILIGLITRLFGKKNHLVKIGLKLGRIIADIAIIVFFLEVFNCFVLYRTTTLYTGSPIESFKGNNGQILMLREQLVKRANELSVCFVRDTEGNILYEGDMPGTAVESMKKLGGEAAARTLAGNLTALDEKLKLLEGFYSRPKPFWKSDFFSQQYIMGYYFPFTLESNYNDIMYIANKPATMCHELAHLKGFIYEDEANFISYLACIDSGDDFFEYSGVLMALSYVNEYVYKMIDADPSIYDIITKKNDLVIHDSVFLTEEAWNEVEEDALINTDTVAKASDDFINTNLTMNGIEDGTGAYSRVVDLLLKYYFYGEQYSDQGRD